MQRDRLSKSVKVDLAFALEGWGSRVLENRLNYSAFSIFSAYRDVLGTWFSNCWYDRFPGGHVIYVT